MSIDPDDFEGKLVLIIGRGEQFILSRKSTCMVLNRAKFLFRSYDYLSIVKMMAAFATVMSVV